MRATPKLTWIEMKLFFREPMALIFSFAFPFFVMFILAGVFGNEIDTEDPESLEVWRGVGPADYYVPAYVGIVMASMGLISLPLRLATYRERGVLRRFRAAGFPAGAIIISQVAVALGIAAVGAIAITVSSTLFYGTQAPEMPLATLGAWLLGAGAFAAIGIFLGAILPTARTAQGGGLILFFMMMFISGGGPPRGVLTTSMRTLSDFLPLTHVVLMLQETWLGYGWDTRASLITVAFFVCTAAAGLFRFRWG
ncbi:ABC transporter permease [bacterium]|nr:MAG: ABC transporter permease [bacterium]RIL03333.1 MAG: ABC transporter [bacterium]